MSAVIEVQQLHKTYTDTVAVDNISFTVERGEVFGILGPNGAGKTTTVECVEGLRQPDGGDIRVLGLNPARDRTGLITLVLLTLAGAADQLASVTELLAGHATTIEASLTSTIESLEVPGFLRDNGLSSAELAVLRGRLTAQPLDILVIRRRGRARTAACRGQSGRSPMCTGRRRPAMR
jgi:ABC-type cobalamin/Fe3+-siderophores transport system ATPase subunit